MLRLPDGMREKIKAAADANGRSMNAEIITALASLYSDGAGAGMRRYASDFEAANTLIHDLRKMLAAYEAKLELLRTPSAT